MSQVDKNVLHPSKDALLQAELAAPGQEDLLKEAAVIDARKCMNAMRTVGAALAVVAQQEVKQAEHFQSLLEEASRVSRMLVVRWGHNPEDRRNRWMLNVVEKALLPYLSPSSPLSDETVDRLADVLAERQVEFSDTNAWKKEEMIEVAVFSGVSRLIKAQNDFDFGRKTTLDSDIETLRDQVWEATERSMDELCPELTPHEERVTFFVLLLEQLFEVMEATWRKNALRAQHALSRLSKDQLKQWKVANPQGFELAPVSTEFEQNAGRLLRLTVASRKNDKKSKK